uniref:Uncharacterized protein n=1 Tax=Leersia perrieri TaxID=77586 RepID=A0A0D9WQP3_9ORYZ
MPTTMPHRGHCGACHEILNTGLCPRITGITFFLTEVEAANACHRRALHARGVPRRLPVLQELGGICGRNSGNGRRTGGGGGDSVDDGALP